MKKALILILLLIPVVYGLKQDAIYDIQNNGDIKVYYNADNSSYTNTLFKNITSKQEGIWTVNITKTFRGDTTYRFILPEYGVVDYVKTNSKIRIEENDGRITITGISLDRKIDMFLQYVVNEEEQKNNYITNSVMILLGVTLLSIIIFLIMKLRHKKKEKAQHTSEPNKQLNRELHTERQLQIIDYIKKHGSVTQAQLEHELKLPKSSLSRNIETLVQKGVLFKESKGMSNYIGFKNS
jgi:hypothetical protein